MSGGMFPRRRVFNLFSLASAGVFSICVLLLIFLPKKILWDWGGLGNNLYCSAQGVELIRTEYFQNAKQRSDRASINLFVAGIDHRTITMPPSYPIRRAGIAGANVTTWWIHLQRVAGLARIAPAPSLESASIRRRRR